MRSGCAPASFLSSLVSLRGRSPHMQNLRLLPSNVSGRTQEKRLNDCFNSVETTGELAELRTWAINLLASSPTSVAIRECWSQLHHRCSACSRLNVRRHLCDRARRDEAQVGAVAQRRVYSDLGGNPADHEGNHATVAQRHAQRCTFESRHRDLIENRLVRSDPELGRKLKTRATSQEPRFNGFWAVVVLPCHRLTQLRNTPASFVGSRFSVHFADRHVMRRIEKEWVEGNKDIL